MKKLLYSLILSLIGFNSFSQDFHQVGMDFTSITEKDISVNGNGDVLMFIKNSGTTYGHVWYWQAGNHTWTEINGSYNTQAVNHVNAITDGTNFFISYLDGFDDFHVFEFYPGLTNTEMSAGLSTDLFQGITTIFRSDATGKLYLAGSDINQTDINIMEYNGAQWDTLATGILGGIGATVGGINDVSGYVNATDEFLGVSYFDGTNNQIALLQSVVGSGTYNYAAGTGLNNQLYSARIEVSGDGTGFPSMLTMNDNVADSIHYFEFDGTGFSVNSGMTFSGFTVYNIGMSLYQGKKRILVTRDEASGNNKVFEWNGGGFTDLHPTNGAVGYEFDTYSSFATNPLTGKPYLIEDQLSGTVKIYSLNKFPTLQGFNKNDLCGAGGYFMDSITFEDMDSDSVWISVTSDNQSVVSDANITVGFLNRTDTTSTYDIYISPNQAGTANIIIAMFDGVVTDTIYESITVHLDPTIDYSALLAAPLCNTNGPLDPTSLVTPAGGTWAGNAVVNGMIDPIIALTNSTVYYDVYDVNGCYATAEISLNVYLGPEISDLGATAADCGLSNGIADIDVTFGSADDYFITWSTGDTNVTTVPDLEAGQYQVEVIDTNSCKSFLAYAVPSGDIGVAVTSSNPTCAGATDGDINITVTGVGPFTYYWINGQTTEDITNLSAGVYDVTITDANGCTTSEIIDLPGASSAMSLDAWANDGGCSLNDGGVTINQIVGGTGPYTFLWSNAQTSQNLLNVGPGTYSVTITDAGLCTYAETFTVSLYDGPSVYLLQKTDADCNMSNGAIDMEIMANQNAISTIVWSNSATTEDLTGLNAGIYTVVVTDVAGCEAQVTTEVEAVRPVVQPICFVTVDSSTTTNLLIWERATLTGIDHYNIYRETGSTNNYVLVGTVSSTSDSEWNDVSASPLVTSWRYKMTQVDDCGVESMMSPQHKTMHVAVNQGTGTNYNIFWDQYEGIPYSTVNLYRYDATNGIATVAVLPSVNTSYTDNPGLDTIGIDYFVGFDLPQPCVSTRAQSYNGTRSNRSAGVFDAGNGVGLSVLENDDLSDLISVYPNPNNGQFTVDFGNSVLGEKIVKVLDARGRVILYKKTTNSKLNLNLSYIENGFYFVEVLNNKNRGIKKIIKN